MISKKKEEYTFVEGAGSPFEMNPRYPIEKTTTERQKPVIINLADLNGDRAPKNFHRKAGRTLASFTEYWTPEKSAEEVDDAFDVE